jgi:GWxTD domain-containing protein
MQPDAVRHRARTARAVLTALLLTSSARPAVPAGAQASDAAVPSASLLGLTDSLAAYDEAPRAFAMLDSAVRAAPRDAVLWHRFGMTAWQLARPKRGRGVVADQQVIRWLAAADTALRLAVEHAPDSTRFAVDLTRFLRNSGWAPVRFGANRWSKQALDAARRAGSLHDLAMAADEHGMLHWRRFELIANRVLVQDGQPLEVIPTVGRFAERDAILSRVAPLARKPWETSDFLQATELFREGMRSDPDYQPARRHLYMALAETERWAELDADARDRIAIAPLDPDGWMAHGLASHRLGRSGLALVAFDSMWARLPAREAARLRSIARILRPKTQRGAGGAIADSAAFAALAPTQQEVVAKLYWSMADPLMLTGANEHEAEFLARLVYTELRWSQPDFDVLGADTDRGNAHVRFGPPMLRVGSGTSELWVYENGLVLRFNLPRMYGTGYFTLETRERMDQVTREMPVSFENVPVTRTVDTIPLRFTRFRGAGDSTSVVVAGELPFARLLRGADDDGVEAPFVRTALFHVDDAVRQHVVDSGTVRVRDVPVPASARQWTVRVGAGTSVLRAEAFEPMRQRAARSVLIVPPLSAEAFAMSDVLLGTPPRIRDGRGAASRFTDLAVTPSVGTFARGERIGLVWETYGLARDDEDVSRYEVSITVTPVQGRLARAAARVLDGAGRALGQRTQRRRNGVTVSFPRVVPAAPVVVDHLALDLDGFAAGTYRLQVAVRDGVGRKAVAWEGEFGIGAETRR